MRPSNLIEVETLIGVLSGLVGAIYMAGGPMGWITYFLLFGSIGLIASYWVLQLFRPSKDKQGQADNHDEF